MERKIPKNEVVKFLIKEILQEKTINSQRELADEVNKKLKKSDNFSVSGKRARKLAFKSGAVISVITKHGEPPKRCPLCNHKLKQIYTKNLMGKKILTGIKCSKCEYRGNNGRFIPYRYEFTLK